MLFNHSGFIAIGAIINNAWSLIMFRNQRFLNLFSSVFAAAAIIVLLSISFSSAIQLDWDHTLFQTSWKFLPSSQWHPSLKIPTLSHARCTDQPANPFLSSGAWSSTHYSPSAQSSSDTSFLNPQQPSVTLQEISLSHQSVEEVQSTAGSEGTSGSSDNNANAASYNVTSVVNGNADRHASTKPRRISRAAAHLALSPRNKADTPLDSSLAADLSSLLLFPNGTFLLKFLSNNNSDPLESVEAISISRAVNSNATVDFLFAPGIISDPISLLYDNQNRFVWGTSFTSTFKVDRSKPSLKIVDAIVHNNLEDTQNGVMNDNPKASGDLFHGAYSLMSNEDAYYTLRGRYLYMFGDDVSNSERIKNLWSVKLRRGGGIAKCHDDAGQNSTTRGTSNRDARSTGGGLLGLGSILGVFNRLFFWRTQQHISGPGITNNNCNERDGSDSVTGRALCMLYDGTIAIVSRDGFVGTVKGSKAKGFYNLTRMIYILPELQRRVQVSNGVACDEQGGIYIVSDRYLHKVKWDGNELSLLWYFKYGSASLRGAEIGRLGVGSGTTPTIMGSLNSSNSGDGLYIVITDDAVVMNVLVIDAMTGKEVTRERVDFGQPNIRESTTEQSVLVVQNKLVIVNNTPRSQKLRAATQWLSQDKPPLLQNIANAIPVALGDSPTGVQQFVFDYKTKRLTTTWVNKNVSIPNGIPSASCTDGLMYGIGRRRIYELELEEVRRLLKLISDKTGLVLDGPGALHGVWTLEGIEWATGASRISAVLGWSPAVNSLYAATEIGPGEILTGTLGGILRVRTW